jgi:hypothetical protein
MTLAWGSVKRRGAQSAPVAAMTTSLRLVTMPSKLSGSSLLDQLYVSAVVNLAETTNQHQPLNDVSDVYYNLLE